MSERLIRKVGKGNFYLMAFLGAFALFILLQAFVMRILLFYFEGQQPGFIKDFYEAVANTSRMMTDEMWAVQNLSQFIGTTVLAVLLVVFLGGSLAADWRRFKEEWKSNVPTIIFGIVIIYALNIAITMIYNLFQVPGDADNQRMIEAAVGSETGIFMVLSVFLIAPFVEEVLFRKLLFGTVEDKLHFKPVFAILISAVFFAGMHATDIFFFQYLPMALVLCIAYSISKNNIFVPMGIHFLNNAMIIIYFIRVVMGNAVS